MRRKLVRGIKQMIQEHSQHPAVRNIVDNESAVVEKALIIAAVHAEPDFLAYLLDIQTCCSSAVSEWAVESIPIPMKSLLDGTSTIPQFIDEITHAYITL